MEEGNHNDSADMRYSYLKQENDSEQHIKLKPDNASLEDNVATRKKLKKLPQIGHHIRLHQLQIRIKSINCSVKIVIVVVSM
jgi:hypothetical protein